MKNNKFTKIAILVLSLALVIGTALAMSVSADTKPVITQQNVSYQGNYALMFAVDASTVTAPVQLYCYDTEPTAGTVGTLVDTTSNITVADSNENNLNVDSYVLKTTGVAASKMTTYYYFKAVDANGNESEVVRYSVAEYLYERLASGDASETQTAMYKKLIEFGDAAQAHFTPDADPISTYNLVTVVGGVVDGYAQGVYVTGSTVTPTGAGVTEWTVTTYKADGSTETNYLASNTSVEIAGRTLIEAGHKISYRAGTYGFEDGTVGEAPAKYLSKQDNSTIVLDSLKVYDTTSQVAKVMFNKSSDSIVISMTDKSVSASEATAFEVSFDIKSITPDNTEQHHTLQLMPQFDVNESTKRVSAYVINLNTQLSNAPSFQILNNQATSQKVTYSDVTATEFNHVCFRVEYTDETKTATKMTVSVNGSEVYAFTTIANANFSDISSLYRMVIRSNGARYVNGGIYLDNVFCGFVKD